MNIPQSSVAQNLLLQQTSMSAIDSKEKITPVHVIVAVLAVGIVCFILKKQGYL
jgi:hypothetical protein